MLSSIARHALRPFQGRKTLRAVDLSCNPVANRMFAGWVSRRPVAIVNEEEILGTEDKPAIEKVQRPRTSRRSRKANSKPVSDTEKPDVDKNTNTPTFTILRDNDYVISSLMQAVKTRKNRNRNNEVLLEGYRLMQDAIDAGAVPKVILFSRQSDLLKLTLPTDVKLYKVPYRTIQLWSNLTTSPGLLGIFETPNISKRAPADDALPLTIICDNVREPGNLGGILRAAAGVGCEKLILLKGCVDLWEPKVLRSAAGAHFRVPIHSFPTWHEIPSFISDDAAIYIADNNFKNEAVAAPDSNLQDEEGAFLSQMSGEIVTPNDSSSRNELETFMSSRPIKHYFNVDYTTSEVVLVLSGETEGLSPDSYGLLAKRNSIRINIPLTNNVESLNAGVALGIITFEVKRQFVKKSEEVK